MILSGMSNMQQLKENIETFKEDKKLDEKEYGALLEMAEDMVKRLTLPCTGCKYCTTHCPKGLDIPMFMELYNEHCFTGGGFLAPFAVSALPEEKRPSACVGCRSCEAVCPQNIKISEALADFVKRMQ